MLFNSADFLLFFPLVLIIYYILPCRVRQMEKLFTDVKDRRNTVAPLSA